ncbi:unnamed protein product, partial [marine sediment metagenome]
ALVTDCEIEIGKWRAGELPEPKWESRGPAPSATAAPTPTDPRPPVTVGEPLPVGDVAVGSDEPNLDEQPNRPPEEPARTPLKEVVASKFKCDRAPQVQEMEYVAANLAVSNPDPKKAPSASAWSQLRFVREDWKYEQVFWGAYWRMSHQMSGGAEDVNEKRLEELIPELAQISDDALTRAMRRLAEEAA